MLKNSPINPALALCLVGLTVFSSPGQTNGGAAIPVSSTESNHVSGNPKATALASDFAKLADVNEYAVWGGDNTETIDRSETPFSLSPRRGEQDFEDILSNHHLYKVWDGLNKLNRAEASAILKEELDSAIKAYQPFWKSELDKLAAKPAAKRGAITMGPDQIVGTPDGAVVMRGARLKVLALVWIAGSLELTNCRPEVERVVQIATEQRAQLSADEMSSMWYRTQLLSDMGLYNRQILGASLVRLAEDRSLEPEALKVAGAKWVDVTSFLKRLSNMDSAQFDALRAKLKPAR